MADDVDEFCDLCELPLLTCVHGMPPPPPAPPAPVKKAAPRKRAAAGTTAAARATRAPRADTGTSRPDTRVSVRRTTRAQTPSTAYRPHIVSVLQEHDGAYDGESLLEELHERMAEVLLEGDEETVAGGETRWRYTARQERAAMTRDGVLAPARRPGLWELA